MTPTYQETEAVLTGPSVFDLSVSGFPLAGSEGPGPPNRKQKQNWDQRDGGQQALRA
jgi:hypothetical protein